MSQLFASGDQPIGASASASVLLMNIQGSFPVGLIGLISLKSRVLSGVFSNPQFESIISLELNLLYGPTLTSVHDYWKNHSFDYMDLCWQSNVFALLFNTLSRFVIAFLSRSKCLLNSYLQSPCAVILEPKKIKSVTVSIVSSSNCHAVMGPDAIFL